MDTQTIINIGAGVAMAVSGWLARQLWDAVKDLQEDIHRLEVDLPSHYVKKDEFADNMREVKEMLSKIFDMLHQKMDK